MSDFQITILRDDKPLKTVEMCDCGMGHVFNELRRHVFQTLNKLEQYEFLEFTGGRSSAMDLMTIWAYYASKGFKLSVKRISK